MVSPNHNRKTIARAVARIKEAMQSNYDPAKGPVLTIEQRQYRSRIDRGPSSSLWTSQVTFPEPPEEIRNAVAVAVESLGDEQSSHPSSTLRGAPVCAEWVAHKRHPDEKSTINSPKDHYQALTRDSGSSATIIFVHGGAFFLNGPGTARPTAARLSRESGSRVIVLDYRLAPQSAFPSQLLDLLTLYLSLLYPPENSYHDPIPASSIVIAGESCGANITLAFAQLLLQFQKQAGDGLLFHNGSKITVPNPAGVAVLSPMGEQALTLPSWTRNKDYDIWQDRAPFRQPGFPADSSWPSNPPRGDVYCDNNALHHPLVSPCLSKSWRGAPPLFFAIGQENLADSAALIAQNASREGVYVQWNQYECMPHCWMLLLPKLQQSQDAIRRWGQSCRAMLDGRVSVNEGRWIDVERMESTSVDVKNLIDLTVDEAAAMIREKARTRGVYLGAQKPGGGDGARL